MTKILRNEELVDLGPQEPRRLVSIKTEDQRKIYEQKGYDILYEADLQECIKRKSTLNENTNRLYTLIISH